MMSMEMIATQMWTYGYVMNQNKLTKKVLHKGMPIVQGGHDCGMMIPDITPPMPANTWYAVMWPLSSRKITFAAATVEMDGQPTGCTFAPFIPMMTCGDPISAPTAMVPLPLQLRNDVIVGMTWMDLLKGLVSIGVSMAIDFVFEYGFSLKGFKQWGEGLTRTAKEAGEAAMNKITKDLAEVVGRSTAEEAVERATDEELREYARDKVAQELFNKHVFPTSKEGWAKKALSDLSEFHISRAFDDNPTFKSGLGGPLAGGEVSLSPEEGWKRTGHMVGVQRDTKGGGQTFGEPLP